MNPAIDHAQPQSAQSTGAELIVRALEQHGVRVIAGIPGGAVLPLYEALARCSRIRHILARHEQAAGFIAQGIARITRRAGVCLATSGPGVTNLLTAIADAKLDSVPLVCITGQVPTHLIGTNAFQEVATLDLARPIAKAALFARQADEIPNLIAEAFRTAESGRPGPVLIDVPKDVQLQPAGRQIASPQRELHRLPKCNVACEIALAMVASSRRPVLYVGGGVVKARAEKLLQRFAEQNSIPVTTTLMAMGALPHDHMLNLGMIGMHGSRATHHVIEESDLLIAIGARFDDRATGDPKRFAPNAKIIHIDIDASEFGKIKKADLTVHADAWTALTSLVNQCSPVDRSEWLRRMRQLQFLYPIQPAKGDDPLTIVREIGSQLPADVIITTDVGQHQMWVAQAYPFARADRWLTSGGLGTMGFGLPAAIGAAIAEPEATVICFTGDGSLLMNIQELATLAELNLNVKIVLFDNRSFGLVRQQQQLFYQRRYFASQFARPCDFLSIARAFGIDAMELSSSKTNSEFWSALLKRGPALLRVSIDGNHNVSPMVGPGAANIDALECDFI